MSNGIETLQAEFEAMSQNFLVLQNDDDYNRTLDVHAVFFRRYSHALTRGDLSAWDYRVLTNRLNDHLASYVSRWAASRSA